MVSRCLVGILGEVSSEQIEIVFWVFKKCGLKMGVLGALENRWC